MKTVAILAGATALAAVAFSAPAFAQVEISPGATAAGVTQIDEELTDVEDAVKDDFDRSVDRARFGRPDTREGLFGSVALTYAGRTGNDESQDFNLAGRVSNNAGPFQQSVGILLEYGEDKDGDTDTKKTSVIYDGNYYFNDQFYAFALGRLTVDGMAGDVDRLASGDTYEDLDGNLKRDAFFGVGPGYRIINNPTTAWRVQAGVGIRYTKQYEVTSINAIDDQTGTGVWNSDTDVGYIASSRFYHAFNDQFFLTNDTDYLTSDANDVATNELGLNVKMTDALATRLSYKTEYVSDRNIRTNNTLGVSMVYGF